MESKMNYVLNFTKKANKSLCKIDKHSREIILKWLFNRIHNSENPRQYGKALQGEFSGMWRYRVGKYRIIVNIQDDECIVLAIDVGLRGKIYTKK